MSFHHFLSSYFIKIIYYGILVYIFIVEEEMRINPTRVAIAQLCSTSNKFENLINIAKCAGWAKKEGACMLLLPECFGFLGENAQQTLQNAEPPISLSETTNKKEEEISFTEETNNIMSYLRDTVDAFSDTNCVSETRTSIGSERYRSNNQSNKESTMDISLLHGLRAIARASGLWISGGGMHESVPASSSDEDPKVLNTHIVLDKNGNVQCKYSKIHLFDVSIPGKVNLQESKTTNAGKKLVVCDSPIGKLGLSTCYDVRFPEMYIDLIQHGAEVLLVPSAFTVPTGQAHWHILLRCKFLFLFFLFSFFDKANSSITQRVDK